MANEVEVASPDFRQLVTGPRNAKHATKVKTLDKCPKKIDTQGCMYVCRKVKNSQARTGHQRGMGGRWTDDDDTHEEKNI